MIDPDQLHTYIVHRGRFRAAVQLTEADALALMMSAIPDWTVNHSMLCIHPQKGAA